MWAYDKDGQGKLPMVLGNDWETKRALKKDKNVSWPKRLGSVDPALLAKHGVYPAKVVSNPRPMDEYVSEEQTFDGATVTLIKKYRPRVVTKVSIDNELVRRIADALNTSLNEFEIVAAQIDVMQKHMLSRDRAEKRAFEKVLTKVQKIRERAKTLRKTLPVDFEDDKHWR